jgi:hypothetical protein
MRIRIAQKGWRGAEQARTLEEVQVGVTLPWVELDGVRFTDIAGVEFSASKDGFGEARLTIDLLGSIEVVYVGPDGEDLGAVEMTVGQMLAAGRIDAQTPFLNRPDREQP